MTGLRILSGATATGLLLGSILWALPNGKQPSDFAAAYGLAAAGGIAALVCVVLCCVDIRVRLREGGNE